MQMLVWGRAEDTDPRLALGSVHHRTELGTREGCLTHQPWLWAQLPVSKTPDLQETAGENCPQQPSNHHPSLPLGNLKQF